MGESWSLHLLVFVLFVHWLVDWVGGRVGWLVGCLAGTVPSWLSVLAVWMGGFC